MDWANYRYRQPPPTRVGKCLMGVRDGQEVFRVVSVHGYPAVVRHRPGTRWILAGWFAEDLLDE